MASGPDLSEFFKLSRPKKPPCKVGFVISKLKDDERAQLETALSTEKNLITASAIVQWCERRKQQVSINNVSNHRARKCTCYDD